MKHGLDRLFIKGLIFAGTMQVLALLFGAALFLRTGEWEMTLSVFPFLFPAAVFLAVPAAAIAAFRAAEKMGMPVSVHQLVSLARLDRVVLDESTLKEDSGLARRLARAGVRTILFTKDEDDALRAEQELGFSGAHVVENSEEKIFWQKSYRSRGENEYYYGTDSVRRPPITRENLKFLPELAYMAKKIARLAERNLTVVTVLNTWLCLLSLLFPFSLTTAVMIPVLELIYVFISPVILRAVISKETASAVSFLLPSFE